MIVARAHWLAPDGSPVDGSIEVAGGRIRLRPGDPGPAEGAGVIDASGCLVLPGLVDPHVHLREPGQAWKEGVANGSRAAAAGGITTLFDMPNDRPPTTTTARLAEKASIFERSCVVNWGLHLHALPEPERVDPTTIASAKLYMARASEAPGLSDPAGVEAVLRAYPRVTVHAEDGTLFPVAAGLPHDLARPRHAVVAALGILEGALRRISVEGRPRVVLCHAATAEEVAWLRRLKAEGFDLYGETCPHYLYFTATDARRVGSLLQVNPPLRDPADRDALLEAVADGTIDWIASDHAPHAPEEKAGPHPPSGIAGAERALPLLLHLRDRGVLSWVRLVEVGCARAAACYGLAGRGGIHDGAAADLVLVRKGEAPVVRPPVTRAATDVYRDVALGWHVVTTLVGGVVVVRDGTPVKTPGPPPGRRIVP